MYASRADIDTLYGEDLLRILTDADFSHPVDVAAVDTALKRAGAVIDSYIGKAHRLPLPVVPEILRAFAVDIAIYFLATNAATATEAQRQRYEDALAHLKLIGAGKAALPVDQNDDGVEETGPAVVTTSGPDRIFTRQTLRDT